MVRVGLDILDSTLKSRSLLCVGGDSRLALASSYGRTTLNTLLYMCSEDRQSEFEEFPSKMRYPPKKIMENGLMENGCKVLIHFLGFWSIKSYILRRVINYTKNVLSKMDIQHFGIKPFTFNRLILIYSTVYYWDKPISKSSYVGFALFFVLRLILLVWFLVCLFFLSHFLIFERTKTRQNLCLSMSFANYCMLIASLSDLFSMSG